MENISDKQIYSFLKTKLIIAQPAFLLPTIFFLPTTFYVVIQILRVLLHFFNVDSKYILSLLSES